MAHYNLIFQGQIIDGASLDEVKSNVARLFKADAVKTAALFSGKSIVIKKNLDSESTKKYLAVLKKAGAVVKAVKVDNDLAADNAESKTQKTAMDNTASPSPSQRLSSGLASLVNYNKPAQTPLPETDTTDSKTSNSSIPTPTPATDSFELAPVDAGILTPEKSTESIEIPDISHLDMSAAQTGSLAEFAHPVEPAELPDIDNLAMSEANTGSLEEFTAKIEPVELPDVSALDIAEQDDTPLSAESPRPDNIEIPDTSALSMSAAEDGTLAGIESKAEPVDIPDTSHLDIEKPEEKQTDPQKASFQID